MTDLERLAKAAEKAVMDMPLMGKDDMFEVAARALLTELASMRPQMAVMIKHILEEE